MKLSVPERQLPPARVSGVVLIPIQPRHAVSMAEVIRRVSAEHGLTAGSGFAVGDAEVADLYRAYDRPGHAYLVAEQDDRVLGGGGFAPLAGGDGSTCEIRKMYLCASARAQGLGARLLQHLLDSACRCGYRYAYLETTAALARACRLYEAAGFARLAEPWGATGHSDACERYYCKCLT